MININRIKLRESVFILSIFTLILEYQTTLVHTFFVDRIIKIVAILVLVLLSKNGRENLNNVYIQRTSKMYLILSLLMVVSTLFNLSVLGVVYLFKYYNVLLIVLLLLLQVNPQYFSDRIIKLPILIGAVLSAISVIFWFLVYFGFFLHRGGHGHAQVEGGYFLLQGGFAGGVEADLRGHQVCGYEQYRENCGGFP